MRCFCGTVGSTLLPTTCVALFGFLNPGCADSDRGICLSVSAVPKPSPTADPEYVLYFYSKGCPECADVKESVIPLLLESGIPIEEVCVDSDEGIHRILEVERLYHIEIDTLAPVMLFDSEVLQGSRSIQEFFDSPN